MNTETELKWLYRTIGFLLGIMLSVYVIFPLLDVVLVAIAYGTQ